ncbi:right-handed parallel beta-helix repeat-containing protein [Saccharophagus degradans]|uniref:Right-handed parallel beta-helix repeat-containing protein n=1 Tax=Saccharophagus degradans TaxID=86304 RepID=A0AAW7XDM6_9GAMM|nr:right-handed parallel beta-helix repeat-containing protein [Saccharophagus degradans]MDO6424868.1 right-handed parallel beta-helix repeat-containing protein [Saccharophagus degradans]MDO6606656.1 right-handed parallel beta-helix repeat-containing protein [Saccharophagus degradans]
MLNLAKKLLASSIFVLFAVNALATECEEPADGDLIVDKDWHLSNEPAEAPDGKYPENGGTGPFETIQQMLDVIQPGDCGFVKESAEPYRELTGKRGQSIVGNTFLVGGTSEEERVVVSGFPGQRPIIDNGMIKPEGSWGAAGFLVANGDYITIKNFEIRNTTSSGIMMHPSNVNRHILVTNNHIHHNYGDDNIGTVRLDWCDYCVVRNNVLHDTYKFEVVGSNPINDIPRSMFSGVHGYRPSNCIIENNLIYNVGGGVFQKEPNPQKADSNVVRYNIFYNLADAAYVVGNMGAGLNPSFNPKFHHNLVYRAKGAVSVDHYETVGTGAGLEVYNNTVVDVEYFVTIANTADVVIHSNIIGETNGGAILAKRPGEPPRYNSFKEVDYNLYYGVPKIIELDRYLSTSTSFDNVLEWAAAEPLDQLRTQIPVSVGEHSFSANPLFRSETNRNYNLANGSPAIGKGKGGTTIGAFGNGFNIGPDSTMISERIVTPTAPGVTTKSAN